MTQQSVEETPKHPYMGSADFPENSRGNHGNFRETDDAEETPLSVLPDLKAAADLAAGESETKLGFQMGRGLDLGLGLDFPAKQTENNLTGGGESGDTARDGVFVFGVNLKERVHGEAAETSTASKRRRIFGFEIPPESESQGVPVTQSDKGWYDFLPVHHEEMDQRAKIKPTEQETDAMYMTMRREHLKREMREAARIFARDLHAEVSGNKEYHDREEPEKKEAEKKVKDLEDPFQDAMELIKRRSKSGPAEIWKTLCAEKTVSGENRLNLRGRIAPTLLELSMKVLGENAEALVSLENVPDELRTKLAGVVSSRGKVDTRFVQLLSVGSPAELRVKNCTNLNEEELAEILGGCDAMNLTVLELDLCGQGMTERVISDFLARSPNGFPALTVISLKGAFRLTDDALALICRSAPLLQSVNLAHCSLLTSSAIRILSDAFKSSLRELYIEDCQGIDTSHALDELKKFKCLNVLSVAWLEGVEDNFAVEFVEACGANLEELVLAGCNEVTDDSIEAIGRSCPKLRTLDVTYLDKLTDMSLRYIANGCRSICTLKFCRSRFSDEAVAAFLEVSGSSLKELSLNNISMVALNTASSLAKCSKNLSSLDLSWCRKLTDVDLRLILRFCPSLRRLKLFGFTQVTEEFLIEQRKSPVQIIGLKKTPVLEHLDDIEPR